ncbi:MAG: hypothetical protein IANPNBLG_03745 [Bryobacteraceae bacterium]|nr:hypothetical protein [Bryobacteraceae bacterium]
MSTHVKVLGILHLIFGAGGLLIGLLLFAIFGGIAGLVGAAGRDENAWVAVPILGAIGVMILVVLVILSLPHLIAGIGLLRFSPWARVLTIVISAIELLNVPFGTALGVYGLWVLLSQGSEHLFTRSPAGLYPRHP